MSAARLSIILRPFHRSVRSPSSVVLAVALIVLLVVTVPAPRHADAGTGATFIVHVDEDVIRGSGWNVCSTVHISISHHSTPPGAPYETSISLGSASVFSIDVSAQFNILPGDTISVTDGVHTKSHVVTDIRTTGTDEDADTIFGTATPGASVHTWVYSIGKSVSTTADPTGNWTADYSGVYDLKTGTTMGVREYDADGDGTQIEVVLPVDPDGDDVPSAVDNCPRLWNPTQYDGDGDGMGTLCDDVDRVSGPNRYATAAAVSQMAFGSHTDVMIALGTNFPDALVAAAGGGFKHYPVLLTRSDVLPPETVAEIERLSPTVAYLVGGTAVISPEVEDQLGELVEVVKRLSGDDRYGTATAVSKKMFGTANTAFVALGTNFPDALVAAAAAGHLGGPVLLTPYGHAPQVTLDELERLGVSKIYLVGGTAAISETVADELAAVAPVTRLAGANRYETAGAVADEVFTHEDRALLAFGGNFPDALVAAAAGVRLKAPVLLVTHDEIPAATRQALDHPAKAHDWIVGGEAVIGPEVFNALP